MKSITAVCLAILAAAAMACSSGRVTPENTERTPSLSAPAQQPTVSISVEPSAPPVESPNENTDPSPLPTTEPVATYLEATVEPCAPVEGSSHDPCDRDRYKDWSHHFDYRHPEETSWLEIETQYPVIYPPYTTRQRLEKVFEEMARSVNYPPESLIPHVIVRGVYLPGTTRCDFITPIAVHTTKSHVGSSQCYMDFEAREYLFGNGPQILTVAPSVNFSQLSRTYADLFQSDRYWDDVTPRVAAVWEGTEVVLWLRTNFFIANVLVWWAGFVTDDVQRDDDGPVVVTRMGPLLTVLPDHDVEPYEDRIRAPLDDYRRDIALGMKELSEEYGMTPVGDANQEHLEALLRRLGVDEIEGIEIVPPPRVYGPVQTDERNR